MNAEIIAIGTELLLGATVDTNSAYLARQLAAAGVNLFRKQTIGDNEERIALALSEALTRADLVICSGGLGPTVDDVTREGVARAYGRPLVFHEELLAQIEARFRAFGRPMSESNRRQAYVPEGATPIANPRGTAPAFIVDDPRGTTIVLPGVPSELQYLFENAVLPYLRDVRGVRDVILVRTLHAAGLGESVIGEKIADLMQLSNPTVGISAKRAQYELRITARGEGQEAAEALIAPVEAQIRARLGSALIGTESLSDATARRLRETGQTIALYEGHVQAPAYRALTATPAGRAALRGATIHPLDSPIDASAAAALAHAGAQSVRDRWRAGLSVGVQAETQPGDDGFTTVCVVLVSGDQVRTWERRFDLRSPDGWEFVATMVMQIVRDALP